jgi:hypothetical protein
MYLSHPVRRLRDDPGEGDVSLVVELKGAGDDEVPDSLATVVEDRDGTVDRSLGFDCWLVTVPEAAVAQLCSLDGATRIETAATLELGVDDDSTKGH